MNGKLQASIIIADLCRSYGPHITRLPGCTFTGDKLLWAIAGNESGFGSNPVARHEPGYCYGHKYDIPQLSKQFGCLAHCSFGPWQMMFPHLRDCAVTPQHDPQTFILYPLGDDAPSAQVNEYKIIAEVCAYSAVTFGNRIIEEQKITTLEQFADAWNSGSCRDAFTPEAYIERARQNYAAYMPI